MIDAHAASSRFLLGSGDHPIPVVVRPIGAPIDEVWRAWTEPDGLVRWLGAAESPVTGVGVPVPLNMMATQMAPDLGSRAVLTPQVVEPPAEGKERLQFTWTPRLRRVRGSHPVGRRAGRQARPCGRRHL